jgi:hypothetical protein
MAARMFFLRTIPAQSNLTKARTVQSEETRAYRLLEHDPEKWTPVFRKDHAQTKC